MINGVYMDDMYIYFLLQMSDTVRKHFISTCVNHPDEQTFSLELKYDYVLRLLDDNFLEGMLYINKYGMPNYGDIKITDEGLKYLDTIS